MTRRLTAVALAALVLGALAPGAHAQLPGQTHDRRVLSDRGGISLGGFLIDFRTDAAVGTETLLGTRIRLEDDLNMDDDRSTVRLDGFYRFSARHSVEYSLVDLSRKGSAVIDEEIEFEGVTYEVGAAVDSKFDSRLLKLVYRFSFINDGKVDAGISAGLSTFSFDLELAGIGTIDDGTNGTTEGFVREDAALIAPIPVFGLFVSYAITPRFVFRADASFFGIEFGDYEARLVDGRALVDYFFTEHFGIGGGFNATSVDVQRRGDQPFSVDYRFSGLLAYLAFVW